MSEETYKRLREFLDKLPGGYPETESGVEMRILKRLFTPEDAELVMQLKPLPEPVDKIAERLGMDEAECGRRLEELAKAGSIFRVRSNDKAYYMAIQFVVGVYEFHLNSIDRELSEMMEEYLPALGKVWETTRTKQLRVIPVNGAVNAAPAVGTYDMARDLVKEQDSIAVAQCICRKEQGLLGHDCDRPHEICLSFGNGADYYVENGMGRRITADEALALLDKAEEAGLVLSPSNTEHVLNICCCCECCCGVLRNLSKFDRPADHVQSSFQASIDPELCEACGTCIERCQISAIDEGDGYMTVNLARCIGCGLCVPTCPEDAITLKAKERVDTVPRNITEQAMRILKERGLI